MTGIRSTSTLLSSRMVMRLNASLGPPSLPSQRTAIVGAPGITARENLVYEGEYFIDLSRALLSTPPPVQTLEPVQGGDRLPEILLSVARGRGGCRHPCVRCVPSKASRDRSWISYVVLRRSLVLRVAVEASRPIRVLCLRNGWVPVKPPCQGDRLGVGVIIPAGLGLLRIGQSKPDALLQRLGGVLEKDGDAILSEPDALVSSLEARSLERSAWMLSKTLLVEDTH